MHIDSTTYVETAAALTQGTLSVNALSKEQIAAYRNAAGKAENLVRQLNESSESVDGLIDIIGVQRVMRSFGIAEGRTSVDFAIGDRVVSSLNERKIGTVVGTGIKSNLVEVSWDGPVDNVEAVAPIRIVRRGGTDKIPVGNINVGENNVIQYGENKFVIADQDLVNEAVNNGKISVTKGYSGLYAVVETSNGIRCTSPLAVFAGSDVKKHDLSDIYKEEIEVERVGQAPVVSEARKNISESILNSTGDASENIKISQCILSLPESIESYDTEHIIEAGIALFEEKYGKKPSDTKEAVLRKATSKSEPVAHIKYGQPTPTKIKTASEIKSMNNVDLSKVSDMIDKVHRAINASRNAISLKDATHTRPLARSLHDIFKAALSASGQSWIPLESLHDMRTESTHFIDIKETFVEQDVLEEGSGSKAPVSLGKRVNFKLSHPSSASGAKSTDNTELIGRLNDQLVSYLSSLQRLSSEPNNKQLSVRAARILLGIINLVAQNPNEPWAVITTV